MYSFEMVKHMPQLNHLNPAFWNTQGGGGTFFSAHGAEELISPTQGSALVWINVKSCGDGLLSQEHGGCPVSRGNKFVLGQWLSHYNQWKTFPCRIQADLNIEFSLTAIQ